MRTIGLEKAQIHAGIRAVAPANTMSYTEGQLDAKNDLCNKSQGEMLLVCH